jgi:hypothetical protein
VLGELRPKRDRVREQEGNTELEGQSMYKFLLTGKLKTRPKTTYV